MNKINKQYTHRRKRICYSDGKTEEVKFREDGSGQYWLIK